MTQYDLRMRARKISPSSIEVVDSIAHTSYDLITYNDDGTTSIQSVDLFQNDDGKIEFNLGQSNGQNYTLSDGTTLLWGDNTFYNGKTIPTTTDFLDDYHAQAKTISSGTDALKAYNKIVLDAKLRNTIGQLGGLLGYEYSGPNCNTWTKHEYDQYVSNQEGVSLKDIVGDYFIYWGEEGNIFSDGGAVDNAKSLLIDRVVSLLTDPDLGLDIAGVNSNQILWTKKGSDYAVSLYDGKNIFIVGSDAALYYDAQNNALKGIAEQSFNLSDYFDYDNILKNTIYDLPGMNLGPLGAALLPKDLIARLKSSFLDAETIESPLILDLDGDGVETTLLSNSNIHFDHDGNGFAEKTAWAGADDGLLVRDKKMKYISEFSCKTQSLVV